MQWVLLAVTLGFAIYVAKVWLEASSWGLPRWPAPSVRVHCGLCDASFLTQQGMALHHRAAHESAVDVGPFKLPKRNLDLLYRAGRRPLVDDHKLVIGERRFRIISGRRS